jgi:hypothetical protein
MIELWKTIESLISFGGKLLGMAGKAVALVRKAQAENREPSEAELAEVRQMDDTAREELQQAINGK